MASTSTNTLLISLEKVDFRQPTQVTDDTSVLTLKNWVFEPLLKWQPGGLPEPALFDRWEYKSEGRVWHFHIRECAIFHDGVACVASHIIDFITGILESRDTFGMRWSYNRYLANAKFSAKDVRTVMVENPEPLADILDILTEFYICRIATDGKPILGTGRYRVVEFNKDEGRAVLEYAKPDKNDTRSPQRIIAIAEPSAEKRLDQLRQGNIDAALNLERVDGELQFESSLQWGKATNTLSVIYYLNCFQGLFASPEARVAVNHAVDTEALVREVFHNLAVPATTIVSPFHLGAENAALSPICYDVEEARRLLKGLDISTPIVLRTPTYMPERALAITRFVATSLEAVGLKVIVDVETDRPAYARQVGHDKRIGDMALFDSSPHSTYRVLDDKISSINRAIWWQGYEDADVDRLITVANHSVEDGDRQDAYGQCLKLLKDNPPWLYLVHPIEVFAARLEVRGLSINCKGALDIE